MRTYPCNARKTDTEKVYSYAEALSEEGVYKQRSGSNKARLIVVRDRNLPGIGFWYSEVGHLEIPESVKSSVFVKTNEIVCMGIE